MALEIASTLGKIPITIKQDLVKITRQPKTHLQFSITRCLCSKTSDVYSIKEKDANRINCVTGIKILCIEQISITLMTM